MYDYVIAYHIMGAKKSNCRYCWKSVFVRILYGKSTTAINGANNLSFITSFGMSIWYNDNIDILLIQMRAFPRTQLVSCMGRVFLEEPAMLTTWSAHAPASVFVLLTILITAANAVSVVSPIKYYNPASLFTKNTPYYGYTYPHYKPKAVWRPAQVYTGNPCINKMVSSSRIEALGSLSGPFQSHLKLILR